MKVTYVLLAKLDLYSCIVGLVPHSSVTCSLLIKLKFEEAHREHAGPRLIPDDGVSLDGSRKILRKKFAVGKLVSGNFTAVKFAPPVSTPPPCTLPSTVHCPVHLHTGPTPLVHTAFHLLGEIS